MNLNYLYIYLVILILILICIMNIIYTEKINNITIVNNIYIFYHIYCNNQTIDIMKDTINKIICNN